MLWFLLETRGSFRGDFAATLGIEMGRWEERRGQQGCRADRRGQDQEFREGRGPGTLRRWGQDTPTGALVFSGASAA